MRSSPGVLLHAHNLVRRDFRKVLVRAKLPRIRFHDLRHTAATLLAPASKPFLRQVLTMAPEEERRSAGQGVARNPSPDAGFMRCAIGMLPEDDMEAGARSRQKPGTFVHGGYWLWRILRSGARTALDTICTAERLNVIPITTPAYSPQSNGMAEAFINTLRRDYIASADLASAQAVLAQIPGWFADYNAAAPHSALGFRSPLQYRSERSQFDLAESVS